MPRSSRKLLLLSLVLLAGCVPLDTHAPSHPRVRTDSTVLFTVTLTGPSAPGNEPTGLIVSVESKRGSTAKQFAFTPNSRIPGHHTTFLVRLDLPAGRYDLARLSATTAAGAELPQLDVAPRMSFDARPKATDYIGHFELTRSDTSAEGPQLVMADAYEEELPSFVHAWPALRGRAVGRAEHANVTPIPAQLWSGDEGAHAVKNAAPAAPRLDSSSATELTPPAQRAFQHFLQAGYPRAFAVSTHGPYTGLAVGGPDVIGRALRECRRVQPAQQKVGCRLFALDDTLLSSLALQR